jgi:mannitol/fructose-specific phosphotransferase system IIA component (Ntr-type)
MVLSAPEETERHLKVLRALASILQNPLFAKQIVEMQNARQVYDLVCQYEASLA